MDNLTKSLKDFQTTFHANRKLTYDLINVLSDEDLIKPWPRPGLNTFEKHFHELAAVQNEFTDSITSGVIDFKGVPSVFDFSHGKSKQEILNELQSADKYFDQKIKNGPHAKTIDWFGMALPIEQHLCNLISHEVFHQGMMVSILYLFDITFPNSWIEDWALPIKKVN